VAFEIDGLAELALDALGDEDGVIFAFEVVEEDGEFIAAEAGDGFVGFGGDGVGGAEAAAEAIADGDEEAVAGGVAETVVDDFETVEIEKKHGEAEIGAAAGAFDAALDLVAEECAIGEAGEGVVHGIIAQAIAGPAEGVVGGFEIGGALADAIFKFLLDGAKGGLDVFEIFDVGGGADPLDDSALLVAHGHSAGEMPAILAA